MLWQVTAPGEDDGEVGDEKDDDDEEEEDDHSDDDDDEYGTEMPNHIFANANAI